MAELAPPAADITDECGGSALASMGHQRLSADGFAICTAYKRRHRSVDGWSWSNGLGGGGRDPRFIFIAMSTGAVQIERKNAEKVGSFDGECKNGRGGRQFSGQNLSETRGWVGKATLSNFKVVEIEIYKLS